ncbi:MAG: SDH family Clp fold serine proteinase [Promethearchaeota archaeon]
MENLASPKPNGEVGQEQKENKPEKETKPIEIKIPSEILKFISIGEEDCEKLEELKKLQEIASNENAVMISFIAQLFRTKISPTRTIAASISLWEELAIEYAIYDIENKLKTLPKKLYLLLDTPGGNVLSSFKIANLLRKKFEDITIIIPRFAASGGTLISFIGNKIIMGDGANLSKIDIQTNYEGQMVSSLAYQRALNFLDEYFKKISRDDAPYSRISMADKLDPVLYSEWNSLLLEIQSYALRLLRQSGYNIADRLRIVDNFLFSSYSHNYVIDKDLAEKFGLKIAKENQCLMILEYMRHWLYKYVFTAGMDHITKYILPQNK